MTMRVRRFIATPKGVTLLVEQAVEGERQRAARVGVLGLPGCDDRIGHPWRARRHGGCATFAIGTQLRTELHHTLEAWTQTRQQRVCF